MLQSSSSEVKIPLPVSNEKPHVVDDAGDVPATLLAFENLQFSVQLKNGATNLGVGSLSEAQHGEFFLDFFIWFFPGRGILLIGVIAIEPSCHL